ncbi:ribonuclease E activity regulator RraA [Terriglobus saanensis]|uniref:4-hydroxy-4-methyl-2-oxoglutarate aldolase n=1 Tax=Terriglobus saanensis (strain ATCC BAA-1853 / DSM 23119 / SP1PR4) TaxID=401053 RepID=E8V3G7_TERSS|nr:ribonuclease E activity regulator RraA [Terriglobus saanensis]ADV83580.1 regulator of ribonuclease activity A [Terriglobus saanensis SP1PR4]
MKMRSIPTADLIDDYSDLCASCDVQFLQFGRRSSFHGRIRTVKCYDDNVLVRRALEAQSDGEVLVVDGAGFLGSALVGDQIASLAISNGWAGIVIFGALRDSVALREMEISIKALGNNPRKSGKNGIGESDVAVRFGNVVFRPGDWIYSDEDGILVSQENLLQKKNA